MSKFDPIRDCKHGHQKGKCDSCDLEQAEKIIEQQQQQIAELEQRNNELTAAVERLRDFAYKVENWQECTPEFRVNFGSNGERDYYRKLAKNALAATPQQNLNAVKREAFVSGFMADYGVSYDDATFARCEAERKAKVKYPSGKDG